MKGEITSFHHLQWTKFCSKTFSVAANTNPFTRHTVLLVYPKAPFSQTKCALTSLISHKNPFNIFYPVFVCFQFFLVSLALVFFAKALCGAYLKSSITQIERRFDIPSSLIGVIDGSFEIGMYFFGFQ